MSKTDSPTKNVRLRFTINDDLEVLRQVLAENPFEIPLRWETISKNVVASTGKEFSRRAIKDHVEYLIMLFLKEDMAKLRKSGTEEKYEEKERLLQELVELKKNFSSKSPKTKGLQVREAAALVNYSDDVELKQESISSVEDNEEITPANEAEPENFEYITILGMPTASSSVSSSTVPAPLKTHKNQNNEKIIDATIQRRGDKEYQIMEQQLEIEKKRLALEKERILLEQRKITLEEEKFQLEKQERLMRLEIEREERQAHIKSMEQQQQLLALLIKQQNSNKNH